MDESASRPARTRGLLPLGLIVLLGMVCGATLLYLGQRSVLPGGLRGLGPWGHHGRMGLERLSKELKLDAEQSKQIEAVLREHRAQIHRLLEESRAQIRALLRPEQRKIFDTLRPERPGWRGDQPEFPPPPPDLPPPPEGRDQ